MNPPLEITSTIRIPSEELRFTFARSSGPGGQNVNKVSSKAVLHFAVATSPSLPEPVRARFLSRYASRLTTEGELVITSQKHRDQPRNITDCLDKLRELVQSVVTPPKRRRPTKPTAGSRQRRLTSKRQQSEKKQQRRPPGND